MASSAIRRRKPVSEKKCSPEPSPQKAQTSMMPMGSALVALLLSILVIHQFSRNNELTKCFQQTISRLPELSAIGQSTHDDLHLDYTRRLRVARSLGRASPARVFLRWLHIPKTGTSFVNTLIRWGCPHASQDTFVVPRKERPNQLDLPLDETFSWDWLFNNETGRDWMRRNCDGRLVATKPASVQPYYSLHMHRALQRWEWKHAVALFRLPLQRVYSNYLHLSRHYNDTKPSREPLQTFLKRTQFWGQQAKLLLGRHYRDERVLTQEEAVRAALIIGKLQFVGLTEEFELSSRLFHAKFGGVPHRIQFENVRPSITRYRNPEHRKSSFRYNESLFQGWKDEADDVVYKAARQRFWKEVAELKDQIEQDGLGHVVIKHAIV